MKLQVPFLQLPLRFDAERAAAEIAALGEDVWRPHPQGYPGNSALPLTAAYGDANSDAVRGPMRATPQLQRCPYIRQVLHSLGAVLGRSRLMRLAGQAEVTPHVDIDYYWREHVRVHLPVITQPEVSFHCGGEITHMAAGECWIFDTWRRHNVINAADRARIHIVADTVGGPGFWQLLGAAKTHGAPPPGWQPHFIAPQPGDHPLRLESVTLPTVKTPWEVREHLGFVLGEAAPAARLSAIHGLVGHFARHWQALWALWGDSSEGWPEYREARDRFVAELRHLGDGLLLRNGIPLVRDMIKQCELVAIAQDAAPQADERSSESATA